ncbi:MAG: VIT1/CCC1 transporter family protein [Armatimonadota bacterium]
MPELPPENSTEDKSPQSMLRDLVFGAEDGFISILALVTGVAAGAEERTVLLAGAVGAVSGAISMAAGNYLGVKSQVASYEHRIQEERRSIAENPEMERDELAELYRRSGLTKEQADAVVPVVSENSDFMTQEMAAHELGIGTSELRGSPLRKALWLFAAYILASTFPVLPYALFERDTAMAISITGTLIALFAVGAARSIFTGANWLRSGVEMLAIALLAGVAGYLVGMLVPSG